tara:strand:+ start:14651 stop:15061 length:411 start_codon:yes stop_codon:yes gene_type:complete
MTFSDRDNFIVASTLMISSESLKGVPRETRETVLKFIRDERYPSITNEEWHEIATGINNHKKEIMKILMKAFQKSISNPSTTSDKVFTDLDNSVKETIDDINFDELKELADKSDDPSVREYWLSMKQLKRDFDEKK